ncbi:MAG: GNAT family N-acetyltransferase [Gemmatimonadota bacterium]|nr:GNAT family N-acetyltransferase [Gemmatimonadota bacterium]MDH5196100.1 GNAT family N-acetyltransferase [Gemmatimonadota bacterium]
MSQTAEGTTRGPVRVRAADHGLGHRQFVRLPYALYRRDPLWIPPLRLEEWHRWSRRHNASLGTRWVRRFVAMRDGQVTGRIATIVDPAFAQCWEAHTALFGFFECANDVESATALLTAAEAAAGSRGMRRLLGPVNLTPHDETGILMEGFDSPATIQSPYNPPYYRRLLESAGYRVARQYYAYSATPDDPPTPAIRRLVRSAARGTGLAAGVTIRSVDLGRWVDEARTLWRMYNAAFAHVWGFVPITWEEFYQRARRLKAFAEPELIRIAEFAGEPVGFGLTLPDLNEALRSIDGRLLPFGWWRLRQAVPRIRTVRFLMLGVVPEHRGRGIGPLIAYETQQAARRLGMARLDLSLVQTTNALVQRVIDGFGSPVAKVYGLFARSLAGTDEHVAVA